MVAIVGEAGKIGRCHLLHCKRKNTQSYRQCQANYNSQFLSCVEQIVDHKNIGISEIE